MKKEMANNMVFAMYMMTGSFFHSMKPCDRHAAARLQKKYQAAKEAEQLEAEDAALTYSRKVLKKELPAEVFQEDVQILLKTSPDENGAAFIGTDYCLCLYTDGYGKTTWLWYELYHQGSLVKRSSPCRVLSRREQQQGKERRSRYKQADSRRKTA